MEDSSSSSKTMEVLQEVFNLLTKSEEWRSYEPSEKNFWLELEEFFLDGEGELVSEKFECDSRWFQWWIKVYHLDGRYFQCLVPVSTGDSHWSDALEAKNLLLDSVKEVERVEETKVVVSYVPKEEVVNDSKCAKE